VHLRKGEQMAESQAEETSPDNASKSLSPGKLIAGGFLGCCLAAGLFSLVFDRYFVLRAELANMPNDVQLAEYNAARYSFGLQKGAAQIAALGLLVGLAIGAVGLRHPLAALFAGGLGALLGGLGGWLSAMLVAWLEKFRDEPPVVLGVPIDPLLQAVLIQASSWCLVGMAVGFGLFLAYSGLKQALSAAVGGLLGGVIVAFLYVIVSSIPPFANANNLRTVPESLLEMLVWAVLGGLALAGCIYASVQPKKNAAAKFA
jgi:hypothetical protein